MPSFGKELQRERELRQISLREISEATKINLRYLEAMESNNFAELPGGVFNRGFVRAYCQFIGVDPEAMVNAYLLEERGQGGRPEGPDKELLRGRVIVGSRTRVGGADRSTLRGKFGWVVLVLIVLGVAAGVLFFISYFGGGSALTEQASPSSGAAQGLPGVYAGSTS